MENRVQPAGNVQATVGDGTLLVFGDAADNHIRLQSAGNRAVMISSTDGSTTINGQGSVLLSRVRGVFISMGDGNDGVDVNGLRVRRDLHIDLGAGNDELSVSGGRTRRRMTLNAGVGDDMVNVTGTRVGRHGATEGGAGTDQLGLASNRPAGRIHASGFENVSGAPVSRPTPPANAAPVANPDTATVIKSGTVGINVVANDSDSEGRLNPGSVSITQQPTNGTATVNTAGTVSYTHNGNDATSDTFQYTVRDAEGNTSSAAAVTITVTAPANTPPVANNDTATVTKGGTVSVNVLSNDTDSDGTLDLTSVTITQQTANGTATVKTDGTITYINDGSAATRDTFRYTVRDDDGAVSGAATVTIAITAVPPTANDDTATVAEGRSTVVNVAANDTAVEATLDLTSIVITQQPVRGTVTVNADGTVAYAHVGSETTSDTFRYTIADSKGTISKAATVTITVVPVNDPPVAGADTSTVAVSGTVTIFVAANDTDAEGQLDLASIEITQQPTHGAVTVNAKGTLTYVHDGSTETTDSIEYVIRDTEGAESKPATVSITITPANAPPVANDDTGLVAPNGMVSVDVTFNDTDAEGQLDTTSVAIAQQPAHGTATANTDGTVTYVHDGSAGDTDTFRYTIRDLQGAVSGQAKVTINIVASDVPPVANEDTAAVAEGASISIIVAGNDSAPNGILDLGSITIVRPPSNGTVTVDGAGSVTYQHNGSETTNDVFRYTIRNTQGLVSNEAKVIITVSPVNDAPVANADTASVAAGGTVSVPVAANDTDADSRLDLTSVEIVQQPTRGTATPKTDGSVTYVSNGKLLAGDSFSYFIRDEDGVASNTATVTINFGPIGLAPAPDGDVGERVFDFRAFKNTAGLAATIAEFEGDDDSATMQFLRFDRPDVP